MLVWNAMKEWRLSKCIGEEAIEHGPFEPWTEYDEPYYKYTYADKYDDYVFRGHKKKPETHLIINGKAFTIDEAMEKHRSLLADGYKPRPVQPGEMGPPYNRAYAYRLDPDDPDFDWDRVYGDSPEDYQYYLYGDTYKEDEVLLLLRGGWLLPGGPDDIGEAYRRSGRDMLKDGWKIAARFENEINNEPPEARGLPGHLVPYVDLSPLVGDADVDKCQCTSPSQPGHLSDEDVLLLLRGGWLVEDGPEDCGAAASALWRMCMEAGSQIHTELDLAVDAEPLEARGLSEACG